MTDTRTCLIFPPSHKAYFYRVLLLSLIVLSDWAVAETIDSTAVNREIERLQTQIESQQTQSDKLNDELAKMEKKISDLDQAAYTNEQKIDSLLNRLQQANQEKEKLDAEIEVQRAALAQQLVAMYTAGDQSYLRLLLRQDNPSDISRTLRYFQYLNKHRTGKITNINASVEKVQKLANAMEKDRLELTNLEETLKVQKQNLQVVINSREDALKRLNSDIQLKQNQVERLQRQAAKLQTKFDELAASSPSKPIPDDPEEAEPSKVNNSQELAQPLEQPSAPEKVASDFTPNKNFSTLKGRLPSPVTGQILHHYGSALNEKQNWQGVVIAAPSGAKVRAVASGKVVYAGQMDGYGFLTIIEHDRNYMTLYAYNRANYKRVGDVVNAGDVIAAVGNSGGQVQDALYFEVRKRGIVQNPAQWLR